MFYVWKIIDFFQLNDVIPLQFSFVVGLTIYIRYRQIIHVTDHHEVLKELVDNINRRSLYFGLISCYGISIVANFQETNVRLMHYVGAFSA